MTKEELINIARNNLGILYDKYKSKGILAIYVWGSVLRSDFDPINSDVDIICIVSSSFPVELNELIRKELTQLAPNHEWGFQIVYLDELNGGPVKSKLAKAMNPRSILPTFDSWLHICGNKFKRDDFKAKDASYKERMTFNIQEINQRLYKIPADDEFRKIRDRKGAVKACLFLIYNRQLDRGVLRDLDYNRLPDSADQLEQAILETLLKIKDESLYDDSFDLFVDDISIFTKIIEKEITT